MRQTSRDKTDRLQRATAESTTSTFDGYGLRCHWPARPAPYASYLVLVHRLASLLHASCRPRLATTPLRFAITSPPSGCEGDSHTQAVNHARRTKKEARAKARASRPACNPPTADSSSSFPALPSTAASATAEALPAAHPPYSTDRRTSASWYRYRTRRSELLPSHQ